MSSYHIVQAIWVGVFPMLAAAVLVGALCYLLCCLNQIKERIVHSRKKRRLREAARKKALKDKERQQHHHSLSEPIKIDTKLVNVSQSQYKPVKVEAVNLNESLSSTSAYTLATNPNKKNLLLGTVDSQHSTSPNYTRNYNNINSNPSVYNSSNTNNHYYHHHHHHNHHNHQQTPPNLSNLNRPSSFKSVLPNNHNTSLTNKPSLSITTADLEVVDVSDGSEPFNGGKRISMTTTTTTAPLAITDMRKAKRDSTTRRGGGGGNGEGTETSAESELEQLVVQELNESPKSVYSRLQNLLRRSSNTAKPTDNKSTTTPTTTKIDSFKTTVNTTNEKVDIEKQQQQQTEEKKKKDSTTSDLDTNNSGAENSTSNTGNEYDENSNDDDDNKNASNRESKTSASEKNTGSSKNKRKKQQRFRSSSSNKSKQTSTLEEKSSIDINQSPNSNTNINTSIDKARLVGLSKSNRLDIDVEDDLIFADDDSLSSTGLCGKGEGGSSPPPITSPSTTKPSAMLSSCAPTASCLVAKLQRTSYYQTKCSSTSANQEPNTTTETVSCTKCTGLDVTVVNVSPSTNPEATEEAGKEKSSHHHHHHHKSKKTNLNSSLSDIEPDEDMVRNILVKTPPSSTSMPRKHKNNNNKSDNF